MIIPTLPATHYRLDGHDLYGKTRLRLIGPLKCAPVKLIFESTSTTVRTDSSGSIGHAQEEVANVVVLVLPTTKVEIGDVLAIGQNRVEVFKTHHRYTVFGKFDHIELHCRAFK